MQSNSTGDYNVGVGAGTGSNNSTGSYMTFLGTSADSSVDNLEYSTAIGYGATVSTSNQIMVGRATETTVIPGDVSFNKTLSIGEGIIINGSAVVPFGTPASATATGTKGQIEVDADYIYVCVATNTWKRVGLSTW